MPLCLRPHRNNDLRVRSLPNLRLGQLAGIAEGMAEIWGLYHEATMQRAELQLASRYRKELERRRTEKPQ